MIVYLCKKKFAIEGKGLAIQKTAFSDCVVF